MITTIQNKQIKQIMKLKKNARERRKQQLFLVEGIRMFTEIPEQYLYKVYASEDFYKEHQAVFEGMEVELVSDQVMKEISDTMTPPGVLALVRHGLSELPHGLSDPAALPESGGQNVPDEAAPDRGIPDGWSPPE